VMDTSLHIDGSRHRIDPSNPKTFEKKQSNDKKMRDRECR
jgi:hypothetical protein